MTASRITPAYAGKTIPYADYYAQDKDHPRLRGENYITVLLAT